MADGYAIEAQAANAIERRRREIKKWKYSPPVFLPHAGRDARGAGGRRDLPAGRSRRDAAQARRGRDRRRSRPASRARDAIRAAYDRFYKGDIAQELVRGMREQGGLFTMDDLANWKVKIEEPMSTTYKGVEVYKLAQWQQGPALLQALNILENVDVKAMGYNSPKYLHTLYQTMNLAFADRDFYYGDPAFPPDEPMRGLLSKEYAKARATTINADSNDPTVKPGDPYPFQGGTNPFTAVPRRVAARAESPCGSRSSRVASPGLDANVGRRRSTPARRRFRRRTRPAG